MTKQNSLKDKYYNAETSVEEEKELKHLVRNAKEDSAEKLIFDYYENETVVPEDLEATVFDAVENSNIKKKSLRKKFYTTISAAAVVLVILSVYISVKSQKQQKMEDNFFVMEQALYQISESIQPQAEQEEMLVLWVDDDVEIIIN